MIQSVICVSGGGRVKVIPILPFVGSQLTVTRDFVGFRSLPLILPILSPSYAAKMAVGKQQY
jgi:hypothetical protein